MSNFVEIILPCYNPSPNWAKNVVSSYLTLVNFYPSIQFGLVIVNDGSSNFINEQDLTEIKNQIVNFKWVSYPVNMGKGYALRQGVLASSAPYILYTDIDFPYEAESMRLVLQELLNDKCDIVAGSRGETYYDKVPKVRIVISKVLRFFNRTFLNMKVNDTQCGLKAFNTRGKNLFLQTTINRYLFDLEFIYLASNTSNVIIRPLEVSLKPGIIFSKMNFKILRSELASFFSIVSKHFFKS